MPVFPLGSVLIDIADDATEMLAVTWDDTDDFPRADDFRDDGER